MPGWPIRTQLFYFHFCPLLASVVPLFTGRLSPTETCKPRKGAPLPGDPHAGWVRKELLFARSSTQSLRNVSHWPELGHVFQSLGQGVRDDNWPSHPGSPQSRRHISVANPMAPQHWKKEGMDECLKRENKKCPPRVLEGGPQIAHNSIFSP